MTTNTTPATPGAVIDIKLSATAAKHAGSLLNQTLGASVDKLLAIQQQAIDAAISVGTKQAGSGFQVNVGNNVTVKVNGYQVPVSESRIWSLDEKSRYIDADSIKVTRPNVSTSVVSGEMSYEYTIDGNQATPKALTGSVKSFLHTAIDTSEASVYGTSTVRADCYLEFVYSAWDDNNGASVSNLSGKLFRATLNGSKLLKSEIITGHLTVTRPEPPMDLSFNPLTGEPVNPQETSTSTPPVSIAGSIASYNTSYYDGSFIRLSGGTSIQASRETSALTALSHADNWAGDDKISIILPDHIEQSININSGAGNDTVIAQGSDGELTIDTGAGDDLITLLDDQPMLSTGEGIDTLRAGFSEIDMNRYTGLENLVFTGKAAEHIRGNELANQITGGKGIDTIDGDLGDDVLHGLAGNDRLFGSSGNDFLYGDAGNDYLVGGEGSDAMYGGAGNDIYVVDGGEIVSEARSATNDADSGGIDEVRAWITYKLGADLEKLTLLGEAHLNGTGNAKANSLTGNGGRNTLRGESGNDFLDGKAGDDRLYGGAGNDTLWGNEGNDQLYGDEGIDVMWGGSGDDVYLVDHLRDRVSEAVSATDSSDAGGTDDTVYSSVSFVLADRLEHLIMRDSANPISGTGNAANNIITGNSGDNLIDGKGGIDDLNGANGSDIYLIRAADEHSAAEFNDKGFEGTDEVRFSPTASPAVAGTPATAPRLKLFEGDMGIERVVIGTGTGKEAITSGKIAADIDASAVQSGLTLVGNAGVNTLIGTAFNDVLIGNAGADTLTGGTGGDKFVFNLAPNARSGVDTLTDFSHGEDQLVFVQSKFANIGPAGDLAESAFRSGAGVTTAQDADDRFLFDTGSGNLYFDRDGSGSGAAVLIGVLTPGTSLSATDFKMVDAI